MHNTPYALLFTAHLVSMFAREYLEELMSEKKSSFKDLDKWTKVTTASKQDYRLDRI